MSKGAGVKLAAAAGAALVIAGGVHHGSHAPGRHAPGAPASNAGSNVALGRRLAASEYDWRGVQFTCLDDLWIRESGWNADAVETARMGPGTPTYAYGIPQANPADFGHPYPMGAPAPQIRWGLKYIARRYGTPCTAWRHEEAASWY